MVDVQPLVLSMVGLALDYHALALAAVMGVDLITWALDQLGIKVSPPIAWTIFIIGVVCVAIVVVQGTRSVWMFLRQRRASAAIATPERQPAIECSNARLHRFWFVRGKGVVNLLAVVHASFRNTDIEHPHPLQAVEMAVTLPSGRAIEFYQIDGQIMRDYMFGSGETRTNDIMGFQTKGESRLSKDAFDHQYPTRAIWKVELLVIQAGGEVERIPLSIIELLS